MKARRGHTLIECLVVIGLIGATLSCVALTMHVIQRANQRVRDEADFELQWDRFAGQLRSDTHPAQSAKITTPQAAGSVGAILALALPDDRTAEYSLGPETIQRVVRRGAAVLHRETYRLPAQSTGRWLLRTGSRCPVVSLVLEPATASGPLLESDVGVYRVDAAVHLTGADSRPIQP